VPIPLVLRAVPLLAGGLLVACSDTAAGPIPGEPPLAVDPASESVPGPPTDATTAPAVGAGPHEVSLIADFGPLPDGSGNAVVETVWTVDADGTRQLLVDTPAGPAAHHVMTDDEHWWWLHPSTRQTVADAEWVHVDLRAVEQVGAELPEVVAEARVPLPPPGELVAGQVVAGHEVLAVQVVDRDEARLTVAGIERPVVHRRRTLAEGTTVAVPAGAVDLADIPDLLRS
jgi:hypothetical protein